MVWIIEKMAINERLGLITMNDNIKRFVAYFVFVVVLGYFVIIADVFEKYLKDLYASTYNPTYLFMFSAIFPIVLGLLLALPHFLRTSRQKGSWKVDWILLLSIGLPTLWVTLTPIISLIQSILYSSFGCFIFGLHPNLVTFAGVVFGYILVTSFGKQEAARF